jgi:hypothetical protein
LALWLVAKSNKQVMSRAWLNGSAIVAGVVGLLLAYGMHIDYISKSTTIFLVGLIFGSLGVVHFSYALINGEIAAKGLLVYRDKNPWAFHIVLVTYFIAIIACAYAVLSVIFSFEL